MKIVTARERLRTLNRRELVEIVAQALSLFVVVWLVRQSPLATHSILVALAFLPPLWIALRHGVRGALVATLLVNALLLLSTRWQPPGEAQWLDLLSALLVPSVATLLVGLTVSQNQQAQSSLRAENVHLKTIMDASPMLIAYIDAEERYRYHNQLYNQLYNTDKADVLGKQIREVVGEAGYQLIQNEIHRALSGQIVDSYTAHYQDLRERWIDVTYVPDKNSQGEVIGFSSFLKDVSKEKVIEAALNDVLELNQNILEATAVGFLVYTEEGDCIVANEAAAQIIGAPTVDALKQNFYQIPAWRDSGMLQMVNQVLATGGSQRSEFHIVSSFGKEVWINCQATILAANQKHHILFVIDDITERIAAEQELARHRNHLEELVRERTADLQATNVQLQQSIIEREQVEVALRRSEENFRLLAENTRDIIFRFDLFPHPHFSYISPAVYQLTGYTQEEYYADPALPLRLVSEADRDRLRQAITTPSMDIFEMGWRHKGGGLGWAEQRHVPIFDDNGQCVTLVGIIRDITERHSTDEQLRKLSRAVEQSSVAITITDAHGYIEYVNPRFTQMTGFGAEDVRGRRPRPLEDTSLQDTTARQLLETLRTGVEWRGELYNVTKSGEPYWQSGVISPIHNNQGRITHFLAVMEDITQRKQQEREREAILSVTLALRAAKDSAEMLALILQEIITTLDAVKAFFIVPDPKSGEMVVDAMYEGGEFKPTVGLRIAPGIGVAAHVYRTNQPYVTDNAFADPLFATPDILDGAGAVSCVPLIAQNTTIGLFSVARKAPMTASDVRLLVAIADMAATGLQRAAYHEATIRYAADLEREVAEQTRELRQANERLQELDRLKSKFVSDVSHELRTPVTNMGLYLKLIQRRPEKQAQYLEILQEEADRLETLVLDILDLAQLDNRPALALSPININELLANVVAAHQPQAESRHLALSLHPDDKLPVIMGDTNKLIQIATNLVANALNYTASGYIRIRTFLPNEDSIGFSVEDSGIGIYPEDLPHLFQRFYRGRRDQIPDISGTGLGLSIVEELVELHSGSIAIESEVGKGSTFIVTLPVTMRAGK